MNPQETSAIARLQDWADHDIEGQITPLTPALLRCKLLLAREDARRARLRRLQRGVLLLPAGMGLLWAGAALSPGLLLDLLPSLSVPALTSLLTGLGLLAVAGQVLAAE
jgi:hypothetical protein